jgi:chaperonin GroEL
MLCAVAPLRIMRRGIGRIARIVMTRSGVFISYRRSDGQGWAGRLFDVLQDELTNRDVFLDIDRMPVGRDFREVIAETLEACDAVLVLIGPHWLDAADKTGRLRLEDPADTHRLEIASALASGVRVFPVLVGGAEMPQPESLPDELQALSYRHAFVLADRGFRDNVGELARIISPSELPTSHMPTPAASPEPAASDQTADHGVTSLHVPAVVGLGDRSTLNSFDRVAELMGFTLGPAAREVAIELGDGSTTTTKDPEAIVAQEAIAGIGKRGHNLARKLVARCRAACGDGAAIAAVLARTMVRRGSRLIDEGANPMALKRGIDRAVDLIVAELADQARDIESKDELESALATALEDPGVASMLAEAIDKVGKDGALVVEEGYTIGLELDLVEGLSFDRGYISPDFVTELERMEAVLDMPYLLLVGSSISSVRDLVPVLEKVIKSGKPLVIIADDVEGEALATLIVNKTRGTLATVAVRAAEFGQRRRALLEDIAILTGGQVIAEGVGLTLENVALDHLGQARMVIVTKDETTIVEGAGELEDIKDRITEIKVEIEDCDSDYEREKSQERLAKLAGGVAVLKVGGANIEDRRVRSERARRGVRITASIIEGGIVPGGCTALLRTAESTARVESTLPDELAGIELVHKALESPLRQLVRNAGFDADEVIRTFESAGGLDVATGQRFDPSDRRIVDGVEMLQVALRAAAESAGSCITLVE